MKNEVMTWEVYKSARFNVYGNLGFRVVIYDNLDELEYDVQYSDLVKFREHWQDLKITNNKELYIIATITSIKGKPKKAAKVLNGAG